MPKQQPTAADLQSEAQQLIESIHGLREQESALVVRIGELEELAGRFDAEMQDRAARLQEREEKLDRRERDLNSRERNFEDRLRRSAQ